MNVLIKQLHPRARAPEYATRHSACFDFRAINETPETVTRVSGGEPIIFRTGLAFEIPEDHVMLLFSRSGHGFKTDIRLGNCVGVIDSDYRDEVMIKLTADGSKDLYVKDGERIAQGFIIYRPRIDFMVAATLSQTERNGGFGSTGSA